MSILRVRDGKGNVQEILALRGEPGKDYVLTQKDKQEIADMIDGVEMVLTATPETINEVIKNAPEGATVQLTSGVYGLLTLIGKNSYPENLTITGLEGAIVDGISLTSGVKNSTSPFNTNVSHTELSRGLTIKNLTLSNSICVRNCCIEDLTIVSCHLTKGSIYVAPNFLNDQYGADGGSTPDRWSLNRTYAKNVSIRSCTIDSPLNIDKYTNSGIYVDSCERVTIQSNTIGLNGGSVGSGGTYGITVTAKDTRTPTSGEIRIGGNTIRNTSNSCIVVSILKNANLHIVRNTLTNCGLTNSKYITVSECVNTLYRFYRRTADGHNTYDGTNLEVNKGIVVSDMISYTTSTAFNEHINDKNNPHKVTAAQLNVPTKTEFNNHVNNKNNPHAVTAAQLGVNTENFVWKTKTYTVTASSDLATVIKNAQPNSIIKLSGGTHKLLELTGKDSYPENITIMSENGAIIRGVCITSGVTAADTTFSTKNGDISIATLNNNITFRGIHFADPFSVRNCNITGLTIDDCFFNVGAAIELLPNSFGNFYGDDGTGTATMSPHYATRKLRDVVIKNCRIVNANDDNLKTAILMKSVENVTIHNNTIEAAAYNGIQIAGNAFSATKPWYDAINTGRITITSNTIKNTGSRSIRFSQFKDAVITLLYNKMSNANMTPEQLEENGNEAVKISNYNSSVRIVTKNYETSNKKTVESNKYNNVTVTMGNIDKEYQIVLQQTSDFVKKNDWVTLTRGNCKECWGTITKTVAIDGDEMIIDTPFTLYDFTNVQATINDNQENISIRQAARYDENSIIIFFNNITEDANITVNIYCMTCDV